MGCVVWNIAEEGLVFVVFNKSHGPVGEIVGSETISLYHFATAVQQGTEVVGPGSFDHPVRLVEASSGGVVGVTGTIVPLSEYPGGISGIFKKVGDGQLHPGSFVPDRGQCRKHPAFGSNAL